MMKIAFEWDEGKRQANVDKHGIDFLDAIEVFADENCIESETFRYGEKRYQTIGMVNEVVLFVVYTYRVNKRRIISARTASKKERENYYELRG